MEFERFVILLPVGLFSKEAAHGIENKTLTRLYDTGFVAGGGQVYRLSEFMNACNRREIDFSKYWLTYVNATI